MIQDYENPAAFIAWLQQAIDKINNIEGEARNAVAESRQEDYIELMKQKAQILASLHEGASLYLDEIEDEDTLDYAERGLSTYAYNANKALELNSVFYMSALLFPTDHKQGEPHNLEIFRDELKKRLGI